jgi:DNA topoisomerase I
MIWLAFSPPYEDELRDLKSGNFGHSGRPGQVGGSSSATEGFTKATDKDAARIKALKLPPAWKNIHLNPDLEGELQATGEDVKGRTQYRYSAAHSEAAAAEKFERLKHLVEVLPGLREQIAKDLKSDDPAIRETATLIHLIDKTGFRIGSDKDTGADKKAFGASTLESRHVKIDGDRIRFSFIGKKGVRIHKTLDDKTLADILKPRLERKGPLFDASDGDARQYMEEHAPGHTPKDYRTYHGTQIALERISKMPIPKNEKELKKATKKVATVVSDFLGNTPTIALKSYIDPAVFSKWKLKKMLKAAEYNPGQPRDEDGQWSSESSSAPIEYDLGELFKDKRAGDIFFHGTSSAVLSSIKEYGLLPNQGGGADQWAKEHGFNVWKAMVGDRATSVFITDDPETGIQYAEFAIRPGEQAVLLAIDIPQRHQHRLRRDTEDSRGSYIFDKGIPPEWITRVMPDGTLKALAASGKRVYAVVIVDKDGDFRAAEFNENQPRDKSGKWSSGGSVSSSMDRLQLKYPNVAKRYKQDSGTEMGSVGSHTSDVAKLWESQISSEELDSISDRWGSDVAKLLHDTLALHDIGKGEAVETGDKDLQHEYTVPILQRVLRLEDYSKKDIELATELVNHDMLGKLMQGRGDQKKIVQELKRKAKNLGMSTKDFATLQLAIYHTDAGSYPYVRNRYMTENKAGRLSMTSREKMDKILELLK